MRTISAAAGHRTQTSRKSWGDKGDRAPIEGPGKAVLGPENCLVAAACEQFCLALLGEDRSAAQPFVLYGPVATGKSRIVQGLIEQWNDAHPHAPPVVESGADFARRYSLSTDAAELTLLRERFQSAGLFVLEGLEQLATKPAAQRELRFTLDTLFAHDGLAIVTARTLPTQIAKLSPRLAGRLMGGLTAGLVAPGPAARIEIVRQFAAQRNIKLSAAMTQTLGESIPGTPTELQSAVLELSTQARLAETDSTPMLVRKYLATQKAVAPPSLRSIIAFTAKYFQVKVADLRSPSRRRALVEARGIAILLARELTGKSLEQIGAAFGGRDHTTILHGFHATAERIRVDAALRKTLDEVRRLIALNHNP